MPRFSHIWPVRAGHELPAKMSVLRIVADPWGEERRRNFWQKMLSEMSNLDFFFSRSSKRGA